MNFNRLFLAALILLISCQSDRTQTTESEFTYTIYGEVTNGEGLELALYLPSQGLDSRIISTVTDGKYSFSGKAEFIEEAKIRFEEDIINESSSYVAWPIIVEPDSVHFNFKVEDNPMFKRITNNELRSGSINTYYNSVTPVLRDVGTYWIFSDPIKSDSMHEYVYPDIKVNVLRVLDSVIRTNPAAETSPIFFNQMITDYGAFEFAKLKESDKDQILGIFDQITSNKQSPAYLEAERNLQLILNENDPISFKNYELQNTADKRLELEELVKSNDYTVLYFWWSGCGPCRKFNRSSTPKAYQQLKNEGIEFVSINTDDSFSRWQNSSAKDSISWVNLYAGKLTGIEQNYRVRGYPTKLVFSKNLELIDLQFSTMKELSEKISSM